MINRSMTAAYLTNTANSASACRGSTSGCHSRRIAACQVLVSAWPGTPVEEYYFKGAHAAFDRRNAKPHPSSRICSMGTCMQFSWENSNLEIATVDSSVIDSTFNCHIKYATVSQKNVEPEASRGFMELLWSTSTSYTSHDLSNQINIQPSKRALISPVQ